MSFEAGTTINDRYRLDRELGQGGMGVVFSAFDTTLQREVAVKLLSNTKLGTEGRARLLQEAQLTAKLDHPNIVTVHDAGEIEETPFIVMQYIEGKTLAEEMPTEIEEIVQIARQICAALDHAHQYEIIHRDLKPENMILTPDGTLKLMDFGLARSTASRLTEEGTIMGTVFYMSPEQALGVRLDASADLYALGVMLYEMCTDTLPFIADNPIGILTQHIHAALIPPQAKRADLPPMLNDLITALMGKEPADRPPSAKAVLELLNDPALFEVEAVEVPVLERIRFGGLVGREEEVKQARELWQKAVAGEGQLLLISGEPGVGKTRLMREVVTQAEVSGGMAVIGESYAESNAPYGAVAQIIRNTFERFAYNIPNLPEITLGEMIKLTPGLDVHFPDITPQEKLDPETEQQRMLEHVLTFVKTLSGQHPLLVVVDDIHWADSGTLAVFQHLARRARKLPVMLMGTYREIELRGARPFNDLLLELSRQRIGTRLKLDRLTEEAARTMLAAIFQTEISDDYLLGIYRETDGNPFFIEEVCRALVDSGKLYFEDGEWQRPNIEELEIPQGIQVAVESRLSKLPEDCRSMLAMAAVLGREFEFEVLEQAVEIDEDSLIDALETAEAALMVEYIKGRQEITYRFVHALVPQAIFESTSVVRRRRMHKKVTAALEAMQPQNYPALAYHYTHSADEEQALKNYTLAGEQSLAAYMNADAEGYFMAALELTEDARQNAELTTQLGLAYLYQSKFQEAKEIFQKAIKDFQQLGEMDKAMEAYERLGFIFQRYGQIEKGLETCLEGLALVEGSTGGPGTARLLAQTARLYMMSGQQEESDLYGKRSLELARKLELLEIQAEALATLGNLFLYDWHTRIKMLEEAIEIAKAINLPRLEIRAYNNLGNSIFSNRKRTIELYQSAIKVAQKIGDLNDELYMGVQLVSAFIAIGNFQEASERLSPLRDLVEMLTEGSVAAMLYREAEIEVLLGLGYMDQALALGQEMHESALEGGDRLYISNAVYWLGKIYYRLPGEMDQVLKFWQGGEIISYSKVVNFSVCSIVYSAKGDADEARALRDKAWEAGKYESGPYRTKVMMLTTEMFLHAAEGYWEQAWAMLPEIEKEHRLISWDDTIHNTLKLVEMSLQQRALPEDIARAREVYTNAIQDFEERGAGGWVEIYKKKLAELPPAL